LYQALHATSATLLNFLAAAINADPFFGGGMQPWASRGMHVRLRTPAEMLDDGDEGLSLWLYRVVRDEDRLNDPPQRVTPTTMRAPPLPLRLHYLATPVTNRTHQGDPDTEQYLLGKLLQLFHSKSTFRGADLQGEMSGTAAELFVRLETLSLEQISLLWEGLDGSYQLSVSYEVTLVNIDAATEPQSVTPVLVALSEIGLAGLVTEAP
jgi:hypothetical protein